MQKVRIRFAYRQGFRRVWLILSALWIALMFYASKDDPSYFTTEFAACTALPVAGIYVFGVICVWVIEGFAKADQ